jgi:cyclase
MLTRIPLSCVAACTFAIALTTLQVNAQITNPPATPPAFARGAERQVGPVHIIPVRGNVHMVASRDGNSTVQTGADGVLIVDTITAALAPSLLEAIRTLSARPILQIVNTNVDRAGGNEIVRRAGRRITAAPQQVSIDQGAPILAFETVLNRLSAAGSKTPSGAWPSETFYTESKDLYFNGEAIHVRHQPAAYSDGDSVVLFRSSDVVSVGDIFVPHRYPRLDPAKGGSINGVIAGLNRILELTVPQINQEGGTMVVPAEGRLCDESDVADYRDMVTIVRDRVNDMVRKGRSLDQVKASKPTRDYDPVYATAAYTGDAFVEAVYRSLEGRTK